MAGADSVVRLGDESLWYWWWLEASSERSALRIGIALSGGGVRATVFHLGVLARLARQDLLSHVTAISSVSGGSLAAGLVFAAGGNRWPDSAGYLNQVVPHLLRLLTERNIQSDYVRQSLMLPWRLIAGRAAVLGNVLERQWGIGGRLADLPTTPRWIINATCYQSGKNWRFERDLMGDYQTKYVVTPDFRLADALAASAAVPGLIGPLVVRSSRYRWSQWERQQWQSVRPQYARLHLWDGGVYDNLGIEPLYKPSRGICPDADFLIISDASRRLASDTRQTGWRPGYLRASLRLVDVATDQVRSLRARMVVHQFKQQPGSGAYLRLGTRPSRASSAPAGGRQRWTLTAEEVDRVANLPTTLRRLSCQEFSLLFRHGFEVADQTLTRHMGDYFAAPERRIIPFRVA